MSRAIKISIFLLSLIFSSQVLAAESPDKLYKEGRFAEAEKAYTELDMDHPKEVRFRYDRGCAAYQGSDYRGARAAFSSALVRANDNKIRFRAAYNLGNIAFKKGDFQGAAARYRQAIVYNPKNEDAKANLELALRKLEKQKEKKRQSKKGPGQTKNKKGQSKNGKKRKGPGKQSKGNAHSQKHTNAENHQAKKGPAQSKNGAGSKKEKTRPNQAQNIKKNAPEDLSGKLKSSNPMPKEGPKKQVAGRAMSTISKKEAKALLENVKEDPSRFMRFQIPKDRKGGVPSGKDW